MKRIFVLSIAFFLVGLSCAEAFVSEIPPGEGIATYIAKKSSYPLHAHPSKSAPGVGNFDIQVGAKIPVIRVIVKTLAPGKITYAQAGMMQGRNLGNVNKLNKDHYYSDKILPQEVKIPKGTTLEYLMYRAEGNYLVRYQGSVWEMAPSIEVTKVDPKLETWLQVKGPGGKPTGWLEAGSDSVQVKKTMGD